MWYHPFTQHKVLKLWMQSVVPQKSSLTWSLWLWPHQRWRLVKQILMDKVQGLLDPMQFSFGVNRGVDDATTTLIICTSILRVKTLMSDFNTIQAHVLASKLLSNFNLDAGMVKWILDFLTCRPQAVRAKGALSKKRLSSHRLTPGVCPVPIIVYSIYKWL